MSVDKLKALGLSGLGKYTKDEMAEFIISMHGAVGKQDTANSATLGYLIEMEKRLMDSNKKLQETVDKICDELNEERAERKKLESKFEMLMEAFAGQQRYLERIDAKERAQNLIVIGLSELAIDGATSDSDKLQMVFDEVSPGDAFDYTVRRLGEVRADGSTRPILVTLPSENKRKENTPECLCPCKN